MKTNHPKPSLLIIVSIIIGSSHACMYHNRPYALLSNNMAYVVEFTPSKEYGYSGVGNIYKMDGKKKGPLQWTVDFYSPPYDIHLANSGKRLIRVNTVAGRGKDNQLIEFYGKEGLLKVYLCKDIVKNRKKITISTAGGHWVARKPCVENYLDESKQLFRIAVVDKHVYEFDLATGAIINEYTDSCAMNDHELYDKRYTFGQQLIGKVDKLTTLSEHFRISYAYCNGISSHDMHWDAHLEPLKPLPFKGVVEFITSVDIDRMTTTMTMRPEEIINVLETVYNLPFVKNRMSKSRRNTLRIRISGCSYNQENYGLIIDFNKYVETMKQHGIAAPEADRWVNFFIDRERLFKNDIILSFYYPLGTNVLFSSSTNSMDEPIFREKEEELCNTLSESDSECIIVIDTLGNFSTLTYLQEPTPEDTCFKMFMKREDDLLKKDFFEVDFENGFQEGSQKIFDYLGEPDTIVNLGCYEEKMYFYNDSYITSIRVENNNDIRSIEAKKQ